MKNIFLSILILSFVFSCELSSLKQGKDVVGLSSPEFSPAQGNYKTIQNVTITSSNDNAIIKYTTDGTTPSKTNGTIYSSPIELSIGTTTLKAICLQEDYKDSAIVSGSYDIRVVATPFFSHEGGTHNNDIPLTISSTTSGATIRYTTDGSNPSLINGTVYSGSAISITGTTTVKAIAYREGYGDSQIIIATYTVATGTPQFSATGGAISNEFNLSIVSATTGATIRYTTDNSSPTTEHGTVYSSPIPINGNVTIKVFAYKSGYASSSIVSETYTLTAATPVITPASGMFVIQTEVSITTETEGATIRYTTDGSTPTTTAGTVYNGQFLITASTVIKAIAYKTGFTTSAVANSDQKLVLGTAVAPVITPSGGVFHDSQAVSITCETAGVTIRYTTNGSDPNKTNGVVYSGSFNITDTVTIKAVAYSDEYIISGISSASLTKTQPYNIGDVGPAGGYIFYINPNASTDGWRYLESAPVGTEWTGKVWGGYSTTIPNAQGTAIGTGLENTVAIVTAFGNSEPYQFYTDYAAKLCYDLEHGGSDDWFLPSKDELDLMYRILKVARGLGGFANEYYWSSSDYDVERAWYQDFSDGDQLLNYYMSKEKALVRSVRAVRRF